MTSQPELLLREGSDECLARLGELMWHTQFVWEKCGFTGGLRINGKVSEGELTSLLPPNATLLNEVRVDAIYSLLVPENGRAYARGLYSVYRNGGLVAKTGARDEALRRLADQLHADIAVNTRDRTFVHAGVVGLGPSAILLPGPTRAGKTTLVRALLDAGATYLSDEYAVLDEKGWVEPYAIPLSVRGAEEGSGALTSAESLGAFVQRSPLPVRMVLALDHNAERGWQVERMTPACTVMSLLGNSVGARRRPEAALRAAQRVAMESIGFSGTRGEAAGAAARIAQMAKQLVAAEKDLI